MIQQAIDVLASADVTALLAAGGLAALFTVIVRYFKPPDEFCAVDRSKRRWTSDQSERYFEEKGRFERADAVDDKGASFLLALILWLIIFVSIIGGGLVLADSVPDKPVGWIIVGTWLTAIVIAGQRVGYRWRVAERYVAFRDGKWDWMTLPRFRKER